MSQQLPVSLFGADPKNAVRFQVQILPVGLLSIGFLGTDPDGEAYKKKDNAVFFHVDVLFQILPVKAVSALGRANL
jgi:hypothetical protein